MKLLVTGICGRLGRALAQVADEQSMDVIGIDRVAWPDDLPKPGRVQTVVGCYTDTDLLRTLLPQCDAVAHTAGPHGSHIRTLDWAGFIDANVTAVCRMLEIARDSGVSSVVLSSTMEVVLGRDRQLAMPSITDEASPPMNNTPYGMSRLLMETMAREFSRQHNYATSCLRYMAFGFYSFEQLGPQLLTRHIDARDVARAVILAAGRDDFRGDILHISPEHPLRDSDIGDGFADPAAVLERYFPGANKILEAHGMAIAHDHMRRVTTNRKAKAVLGWEPHYTFERWLRMHGWTPPAERENQDVVVNVDA
jgi:nucleoside-diphosphate-sugar epimerase